MPEQETSFTGSKTVSMFNKTSGQWEDIPREQVSYNYLSGNYGIDPEAQIDVVSPMGKKGFTQGSNLQALLEKGFQLDTYESMKEDYLQEKYGDRTLEAGALGAARGLTFGLSDIGLQKIGVDQEYLRETKKRNVGASIVGEAGGIALPLLLTGGASGAATATAKGAQAVRAAGTLPRAVAKIGLSTEKLAAKAVTKMMRRNLAAAGATKEASRSMARLIAERAIPKGVGSAVEGAFYGTGQLISEEALGNVEYNAESILGTVGIGTLIGGGVGAGISGAGALAGRTLRRGASKVLSPIKEKVDDLGKTMDDVGFSKELEDLSPATNEELITSKLSDVTPEELRYYRTNKERILKQPTLEDMPELYEEGVERLRSMMKTSEEAANKAIEESNAQMTTKELYKIIQSKIKYAKDKFGGTKSAKKTVDDLNFYIKDNLKFNEEGALINEVWDGKKIRSFIQGLRKDVKAAYTPGKELTLSEEVITDIADDELNKLLRSRVGSYRGIMERYAKQVKTFKGLQKLEGRGGTNWFDQRFIKTLERNYGGYSIPANLKGAVTGRQDWAKTIKDFEDVIAEIYPDNPIKFQQIYNDRKVFSRLFPDEVRGREMGSWQENIGRAGRQALKAPGGFIQDTILGTVANVGRKAGRGVLNQMIDKGGAHSIGQVVNKYAVLEKVVKQQKRMVDDYIDSLVGSHPKIRAVKPALISSIQEITYKPNAPKTETKQEAFKERSKELNELVSNPTLLVQSLGENMETLQAVAPKMAAHAMQQASTAVNYLHSKLPKPTMENSIAPVLDDWEPTDEEIASFERTAQAIEDPLSVLEKTSLGELTEEYVEAIQTVYPALFEAIQTGIVEKITEREEDIPYNVKLQLGILFNSPIDSTLSADFIQMLSGLAQQPEPPQGGAKSLDVASRFQSREDYLSGRRTQ